MARISYKDAYDNESVIAQIARLADDCDSATDAAAQAAADAATASETATAAAAQVAAATAAAAEAKAAAETAQTTASTAQTTASAAQTAASAAQTAASAAQTTANAANTTANAAKTNAATAINANPASIATAFNTSTRVLTTTINPVSGDPLTATATIPGGSSGGGSAYEEITTFDPSTWHMGDLALIKTSYIAEYGTSAKYNWGTVAALGDSYLQIEEFAIPRYETAITNQLLIEGVSVRYTSIDAKEVTSVGTKLVFDTSAGTVTPGQYDAATAYAAAFTKQIVGRISVSGT